MICFYRNPKLLRDLLETQVYMACGNEYGSVKTDRRGRTPPERNPALLPMGGPSMFPLKIERRYHADDARSVIKDGYFDIKNIYA